LGRSLLLTSIDRRSDRSPSTSTRLRACRHLDAARIRPDGLGGIEVDAMLLQVCRTLGGVKLEVKHVYKLYRNRTDFTSASIGCKPAPEVRVQFGWYPYLK